MRPLNRNEKLLLTLCLLAVFVVATVFLYQRLVGDHAKNLEEITKIEGQIDQHEAFIANADYWETRADWIDTNLPEFQSAGKAQSTLLKEVQDAAFQRGFKILKTTLPEPSDEGHYQEIAVAVQLYGELAELEKWVTTLQRDPKSFRHLKRFELELDTRSREQEAQGKCSVQLARWFKPKTRT